MPRLHRTLALFFWYFLLTDRWVLADEEASWGPTSSNEKEKKPSSYWWKPTLPKLPSLPSLPFKIPFYNSGGKDDNSALTTAAEGLTNQIHRFQYQTGSGEGNIYEESPLPTTVTQESLSSESLPTGTSHSPHSSHTHKDGLVSPTSSFTRNTLSTANRPKHNTTFTQSPWRPTGTENNMAATTHLPKEHSALSTILTWTPNSEIVESMRPSESVPSPSSSQTHFVAPEDSTVSATTQSQTELSDASTRNVDKGTISTSPNIDYEQTLGSITSTTESGGVSTAIADEVQSKEGPSDSPPDDISTSSAGLVTTPTQTTGVPSETPPLLRYTDDWLSNQATDDVTLLPDCNKESSGICNFTWETTTLSEIRKTKPTQNTTATNQSNPFLSSSPPMLVPLYTDWNKAMAAWGLAWELHVYGAGCLFATLTLTSALNLLCLPLRCPSGCGYFALVSLFLLAAGCTRSFLLLYDAYGHQDRIPSVEASLMLYEAPFPCLTAAFGLVFLLLSMRSRMQLSYSAFQRPCFLACLVFLHFAAAFGPVTLLKFYQEKPPLCLFLSLISRGAFVGLSTFLSAAYFVFYIYVRADSKHIYHLNNTSPTPAERYNRCPFAESRDWNRAAIVVCLSALFSLACAGLQLYAMLNAMGLAGGEEVFHPWPWWMFQFSCRVCELGVCLTLAFVVAQPVYCSDQLPAAGSCWTELLASKSPILPGSYQWTLSQQEKLAIVDSVGLGETESLPLYTLMDERIGSSLNGLDLLYHSNRALAYRDLELDLQGLGKHEDGPVREASGESSFTSDSTTDLRPPSPINLRRSIDEALFNEALFPVSLFSPIQPPNNHWTLPSRSLCDPLSTDSSLYRTSSCMEMTSQPNAGAPASSSSSSSPERWRGSSSSCSLYQTSLGDSSLVLCASPGSRDHGLTSDPRRQYQTLGAASQESLDLSSEADRSVQEEFISVCRQIDAISVCSETIDL